MGGIFEPVGQVFSPLRRIEWLAPVVGDAYGLAVFELRDRNVAVDGTVAVVVAPLDHQEVAEPAALPDCQSELLEGSLDSTDELPPPHGLSHLWPFADQRVCQWHPQ